MSKKFKTTIRLEEGEAYVIQKKEFWEHLIMIYELFAEDTPNKSDRTYWIAAADEIRDWLGKTLYRGSIEEDEGEW